MDFKALLRLSLIFSVFAEATINAESVWRVLLRPLLAEEVVEILKLAGHEDAIPEGRVVTQGLAAISGFALGLIKGSLLFDLATSNATSQFIQNFNATAMMSDFQGINITALLQMFKWNATNNSTPISYKTTELCFGTRDKDPIVDERPRAAPLISRINLPFSPTTNDHISDATGRGTFGASNTGSGTGDSMEDDTNMDSGSGTSIDTGNETGTKTNTVTQTSTGSRQTCIVLQKPIPLSPRSLLR